MPAARPFGPHCCFRPSMGCGNRHPCRDYPPLPPGHPWPATASGSPVPLRRSFATAIAAPPVPRAGNVRAASSVVSVGRVGSRFRRPRFHGLRSLHAGLRSAIHGSAGQRARLHGTDHPSPYQPDTRSSAPPIQRANEAGANGNAFRAREENGHRALSSAATGDRVLKVR